MKIKVSGSDQFKNLIPKYHKTLMDLVLQKLPKYAILANQELSVIETSTLTSVGLSRFSTGELFINHQLTSQSPKFLYEVYGHELAHFLSTYYFKQDIQHNQEWIELMNCMNLPARESVSFSKEEIGQLQMITIECGCMFGSVKKINRTQFNSNSVCKVCHKKYTIL